MTKRWLIDGVLLMPIVLLAVYNVVTGIERSRLAQIVAQAPRPPSDLKIEDWTQRHIQAVRTLDSHQFAWQVYLPPGTAVAQASTGPTIPGGDPHAGCETTVRVGFREAEDGRLLINARYWDQHAYLPLGNLALGRLLRGRWDRLIVEQAGRDKLVVADPKAPTRLLRLSLPPALLAEARATLSPQDWPALPVLFDFTIQPAGVQP